MTTLEQNEPDAARPPSSVRRLVIYSFLAEVATAISMIASFKFAADLWGAHGLGEWILARRVLALLLPVVVCGLDIAIPRYVAIGAQQGAATDQRSGSLMTAAILVTLATLAAAAALLLGLEDAASTVMFGDARYSGLMLPIVAMMAAYGIYIPCYGFMRGTLRIMEANLAHVLIYGVAPLLALLVFSDSARQALFGVGGVAMIVAAASLSYVFTHTRWNLRGAHVAARELVSYGITRMYAAFALIALNSLPTLIAANQLGIEHAALVGLSLTMVGLAGTAASPIGVTMLPLAARVIAAGRSDSLRRTVWRLERLILLCSLAGVVVVWLGAGTIATLFFGSESEQAAKVLRIAALGAGPYVYFVCMRNVIDAHTERAINTRNVVASLVAFCLLALAGALLGHGTSEIAVIWAYVAALGVLALLTRHALTKSLESAVSANHGATS